MTSSSRRCFPKGRCWNASRDTTIRRTIHSTRTRTKDIYWGDQTWDEMLAGFVDLAMPVKMDPLSLVPPREKPAKAASQR